MTQAMQFSAFKGPFAERIDVWNGKLYMVRRKASLFALLPGENLHLRCATDHAVPARGPKRSQDASPDLVSCLATY